METEKKKKVKKPGKVLLILICVLLAVAVIMNIAAFYFERVLDIYVGKGEEHIVEIPGSENWDKEYYTSDFASAEDCDVFAKDVTYRIGTEGITLLKNENNALPLSDAERKVSFFGRRSVDTVFGGTGSGSGSEDQASCQKSFKILNFIKESLCFLESNQAERSSFPTEMEKLQLVHDFKLQEHL